MLAVVFYLVLRENLPQIQNSNKHNRKPGKMIQNIEENDVQNTENVKHS